MTAQREVVGRERLRLLDLFSGIGGFSLGLERAGFQTVAFCEVSPVCRHLLNHHWPDVPCYDDIRTLTADRLAADGLRVDAICGGFPCQDISLAGPGAGIEGVRSGLWREYARLIRELRPRLVFVENVSALLGRGLGVVLGDLAALGYDAWWDCIPAAAVGAPHRRDRLWLVAYARGQQHEGCGVEIERSVAEGLYRALADAECEPWLEGWARDAEQGARGRDISGGALSPHNVADAQRGRRNRRYLGFAPPEAVIASEDDCADDARRAVDDAMRGRHGGQIILGLCSGRRGPVGASWWSAEPDVGRVAHGVPARVDRLHGLGNAVVPQIPEILGRAALAALSSSQAEAA